MNIKSIALFRGARRQQAGFTLVVGLLFLLLLTILGVTSMTTSSLQEKMAGNLRDQDNALQAAESALRSGELNVSAKWQSSGTKPQPDINCTAGNVCAAGLVQYNNTTWWNTHSTEYGTSSQEIASVGGISVEPRFIVEEAQILKPTLDPGNSYGRKNPYTAVYKVYSRASGTTTLSNVILEETYRVRY